MCLGMTDERSLSTHFIHIHHQLFLRACGKAGSATQRSRKYIYSRIRCLRRCGRRVYAPWLEARTVWWANQVRSCDYLQFHSYFTLGRTSAVAAGSVVAAGLVERVISVGSRTFDQQDLVQGATRARSCYVSSLRRPNERRRRQDHRLGPRGWPARIVTRMLRFCGLRCSSGAPVRCKLGFWGRLIGIQKGTRTLYCGQLQALSAPCVAHFAGEACPGVGRVMPAPAGRLHKLSLTANSANMLGPTGVWYHSKCTILSHCARDESDVIINLYVISRLTALWATAHSTSFVTVMTERCTRFQ